MHQRLFQRLARGALQHGVDDAAARHRAEAQLQRTPIRQPYLLRLARMLQIHAHAPQQLAIVQAAMQRLAGEPQQLWILRIPYHQLTLVVEQREAVAHGEKGGFKLAALLFQQARGVRQRGGIAGKDVKGARQIAQFVAPLQARHRNMLFALRQPRHGVGDGGQAGAEVAVDIDPGIAGDRQRQQGEQRDKQDHRVEFAMGLRAAHFALLRHLLHAGGDVVVERRHQRLDAVG